MATEPNRQWYRYTTDSGVHMAIMADQDWGNNSSSGLANFDSADIPFGPQTRTHKTRKVVYVDPTTFRTVTHPVGTTAAFASLPSSINVPLPGSGILAAYQLSQRVPEKLRIPKTSRNLADRVG